MKVKETTFRKDKGITLIALVVTIIVLLILAGISISMLTGQNGILNRATTAKKQTENTNARDELALAITSLGMDYHINGQGGTFRDYIFSHEADLKKELGSDQVTLNSAENLITYKGKIFTVNEDGSIEAADGIALTDTKKTLQIVDGTAEEATITANLINLDGSITWSSNKPSIVTVTGNGTTAKIKAVAEGTATITASCSGKSATCEVTVKQIKYASSLTIKGETEVAEGGTINLTVEQGNNGNEEIEWSVDDTSKATVVAKEGTGGNSAIVTGKKQGTTATITAKAKNSGTKTTATITVTAPAFANYTWQEINALAKEIAKDSTITKDTGTVTKTINGKRYTATVGAKKTITIDEKDYTVRILGFNHDTLENGQTAYGDASIRKAGISFEFETILFNSDLYQDGRGSYSNNGGWSNRELRTILNNGTATAGSGKINLYDIETAMRQSGIIKSVSKSYIDQKGSSYDASKATVETSNDKLWLLACSEVVNKGYTDGAYAYAATSEGSQYKYYVDSNIVWNSGNANLKKCNAGSTCPSWWWLRSPYYYISGGFCDVSSGGTPRDYGSASYSGGVAPGFAI